MTKIWVHNKFNWNQSTRACTVKYFTYDKQQTGVIQKNTFLRSGDLKRYLPISKKSNNDILTISMLHICMSKSETIYLAVWRSFLEEWFPVYLVRLDSMQLI